MKLLAAFVAVLPFVSAVDKIVNKTIYEPYNRKTFNDPQVLYARSVELDDGSLLATMEHYSPEPPLVYYPVFKSTDQGKSWDHVSNITDNVNGWGMRYQPDLYQISRRIGKWPKGTVLCAGNSIPIDLSQTRIDVYASVDGGKNWEFASHVAHGGVALPNNGETPVWEPHILQHQNRVIVYYADQRQNDTFGQKLSHQTTIDLEHWTDPEDDVAEDTYTDRPGMPTVTKLPTGDYVYMYENGGFFGTKNYSFPVTYRISKDPLRFLEAEPIEIEVDGFKPVSAPYVNWTPYGGKNGTLLASAAGGDSRLYTNQMLGAKGHWKAWDVLQPTGYSRQVMTFKNDSEAIMLIGAGVLPPTEGTNVLSFSILKLPEIMGDKKKDN
ncbi:hypothetical protein KEM56_006431 [Ascosphaera pollenicola]|nr:hypothetical protein KEM56_006431 [Ascosphaera pollenicola]